MKRMLRDWMREREKGALPRLDAMREATVSTERASAVDVILAVLRPDLPVWAVLAIAWIALAATHFAIATEVRRSSGHGVYDTDLAKLNLTRDEALSFLDSRY